VGRDTSFALQQGSCGKKHISYILTAIGQMKPYTVTPSTAGVALTAVNRSHGFEAQYLHFYMFV